MRTLDTLKGIAVIMMANAVLCLVGAGVIACGGTSGAVANLDAGGNDDVTVSDGSQQFADGNPRTDAVGYGARGSGGGAGLTPGVFAGGGGCVHLGSACTSAGECCSGGCTNNACTYPSCVSDKQACTSDASCCSQSCVGGTCAALNLACKTLGNGCQSGAECCSSLCANGTCQA
ncbi:MAG: hypothetical protein M3O46_02595, partial [Myxococcota bacterium]|nr:hypothetical protein [Myxococcota bacterium]